MQKFRWLAILMGVTILGITGFQGYWLKNNYDREKQNLEIKTSVDFRQTILKLQASKLKLEKISLQLDSLSEPVKPPVSRSGNKERIQGTIPGKRKESPISMFNLLQEKIRETVRDTGMKKAYIISTIDGGAQNIYADSLRGIHRKAFDGKIESIDFSADSSADRDIKLNKEKSAGETITINYKHNKGKKGKRDSVSISSATGIFIENHKPGLDFEDEFEQRIPDDWRKNAVVRFLYNVDSLSQKDSVTIKEVTESYTAKLKDEKMANLAFSVSRLDSSQADSPDLNEVTIGFAKPMSFRLNLENKVRYILKRLTLPILFSLFLVGITIVSFILLYRTLLQQRRLAELKNEFISNITHELKTPIATVGVAIEALKNFNAIDDPQRTKEYLDISQNELHRLSLLVDKVLKLSMFENKEIDLKKDQFDCKQLVKEVMNSMKLQFEKHHVDISLYTEGDNFLIEADKLHITSVIYNMLDNALKYSKEQPVIIVRLKSKEQHIELSIEDNGIGIPAEYKGKVFDKFFRVPTSDRHNVKGYGLGLSYVSEVLKRHRGFITVESELGRGSTFTACIPYKELTVIQFDKHRKVFKKTVKIG